MNTVNEAVSSELDDLRFEVRCLQERLRRPGFDPNSESCHSCGQNVNFVWYAPDELWRRVSGNEDGSGVLCPNCFKRKAADKRIALRWTVEEDVIARLELLVPSLQQSAARRFVVLIVNRVLGQASRLSPAVRQVCVDVRTIEEAKAALLAVQADIEASTHPLRDPVFEGDADDVLRYELLCSSKTAVHELIHTLQPEIDLPRLRRHAADLLNSLNLASEEDALMDKLRGHRTKNNQVAFKIGEILGTDSVRAMLNRASRHTMTTCVEMVDDAIAFALQETRE